MATASVERPSVTNTATQQTFALQGKRDIIVRELAGVNAKLDAKRDELEELRRRRDAAFAEGKDATRLTAEIVRLSPEVEFLTASVVKLEAKLVPLDQELGKLAQARAAEERKARAAEAAADVAAIHEEIRRHEGVIASAKQNVLMCNNKLQRALARLAALKD